MSPTAAARPFVLPLPAAAIERPRLSAALDASREAAFTLVVAPPGWGKSVALGSWAAGCGAAWLTLSRWHSDAPRLWTDVLAALRRSEAPVDGLDDPSGALDDDFPLRLADALADAPERPTLVLDDLHLLRGPGLASLAQLVADGAGALHVVAATRADPELPLERLRLAGRLGELRARDLAFTCDEATALFEALDVRCGRIRCGVCSSGPKAGRPACGWRASRCSPSPTRRPSCRTSRATTAPSPTT